MQNEGDAYHEKAVLRNPMRPVCACFSTCGGRASGTKTHYVDSQLYSQEDIKAAVDVIKKEFQSQWNGCTFPEIYYAGDDASESYSQVAEKNQADEVIVLLSSFDVDATGGDGFLTPSSTYDNWNWILVRTNDGQWQYVDHRY